jgi:PhoD-like phosphatase
MTEPKSPLLLGPLLRYVDESSAAVWVELAGPADVTVAVAGRDHVAHTFTVHGHHYALVDIEGLEAGGTYPYTITCDGDQVWPPPDSSYPASRIRTVGDDNRLRLAFGSCRTTAPHDAENNRSHGPDMLRALAHRLMRTDDVEWPTLVLLLGDQVYAAETSEDMQEFIAGRRDIEEPPGEELLDYAEYAHLYRLAWTDPDTRWLLSTLPTAMIFDDHDIRDDWNTSNTWRRQMQETSWWQKRIVSGLGSYWVYQHIGNLSRREREDDPVWRKVLEAGRDGDAGDVLDAFATDADAKPASYRWSYHRDLGRTRLLMVDSRAARELDEKPRRMLDAAEADWLDDVLTGDVDHLLFGTSLPFLLPTGLHHLEAWNEAVAAGAWGRGAARIAERIRQGIDLEHWAAFQESFQRVARAMIDVADGRRGPSPATVVFLSGDVHHSYLAEVRLKTKPASRMVQAVCSPIRNPMPRWARWMSAVSVRGFTKPVGMLAGRAARVRRLPFRWSITEGPWFDNTIAVLDIDGWHSDVRWHTADVDGDEPARMRLLDSVRLS